MINRLKKIITICAIALSYLIILSLAYKADTWKEESLNLPTKQLAYPTSQQMKELFSTPLIPTVEIGTKVEHSLKQLIANMTLEEKIGQLFLARVPEHKQLDDLKTYHLGGYLLFSRDIAGETQTTLKAKIETFQKNAKLPLIIASDEEGGLVSRLSYEKGFLKQPFLSPQALYQKDGLNEVKKALKEEATILHQLGISMTLAPVADVSTDPKAFIYERTLGKDVATTTDYIASVVKEMNELNLGSTLKHFPGYGNNRDSHTQIITDTRSLTELEKEALPPFIAGIKAGTDSILVSHNIVTAIDSEQPTSLSPKIYQLLREELEFTGVIMTDDFDMAGLSQFTTQDQAALKAIESGADLILSSTYHSQIPALLTAVKENKLSEKQIDEHVLRILQLKYKLNLIDK